MNHLPLSTNNTPAPDENTSPDDFMSKERRKLDALFSIKRTRNGIGDAINILTDGHKVLNNPNSTKKVDVLLIHGYCFLRNDSEKRGSL
jgi:hypothetical protein